MLVQCLWDQQQVVIGLRMATLQIGTSARRGVNKSRKNELWIVFFYTSLFEQPEQSSSCVHSGLCIPAKSEIAMASG